MEFACCVRRCFYIADYLSAFGHETREFSMRSDFHTGMCPITTFTIEEIIGTKLREFVYFLFGRASMLSPLQIARVTINYKSEQTAPLRIRPRSPVDARVCFFFASERRLLRQTPPVGRPRIAQLIKRRFGFFARKTTLEKTAQVFVWLKSFIWL